jgi:hypothetical protein
VGDDGQAASQRRARDERVVLGGLVWYVQRCDAADGGEIEGKDALSEAGEHIVLEPAGQDLGLVGVGPRFPQDPGR